MNFAIKRAETNSGYRPERLDSHDVQHVDDYGSLRAYLIKFGSGSGYLGYRLVVDATGGYIKWTRDQLLAEGCLMLADERLTEPQEFSA